MKMTLQAMDLLRLALQEDMLHGDRTTDALGITDTRIQAVIRTNETSVICGMEAAKAAFYNAGGEVEYDVLVPDGKTVDAGTQIARVRGPASTLMAGERIALNLLMRLSGIATLAKKFVDAVQGTDVILLDTRKTTPGLRDLEKAAAACGGFRNHRFSLDSGILIKDNHLALFATVKDAVATARSRAVPGLKVEVEVKTKTQAHEAVFAGADALLLDNMTPDTVARICNELGGKVFIEVSGGITLDNIRQFALAGPHAISTSAIFKFAPWIDMSMNVESKG